jgi:hypothetical protein
MKGYTIMTNTKLNTQLDNARKEIANSLVRGYGAMRDYAQLLNKAHPFDWFEVEHTDTGEQADLINTEKKAFYAELKSASHTNPSVVWARVRQFGKVERYGDELTTDGESIEGEQGESGKESANRSPMLRNIEELTTLWKFNGKQDNLDPRIVEAQKHIGSALEALGIKLNMLTA